MIREKIILEIKYIGKGHYSNLLIMNGWAVPHTDLAPASFCSEEWYFTNTSREWNQAILSQVQKDLCLLRSLLPLFLLLTKKLNLSRMVHLLQLLWVRNVVNISTTQQVRRLEWLSKLLSVVWLILWGQTIIILTITHHYFKLVSVLLLK